MKVFIGQDGWSYKVNFIDEDNLGVGYDMSQMCCEDAGWFVADTPTGDIEYNRDRNSGDPGDLDGWVFDAGWFREVESASVDEGGVAVFRLAKDGGERFLHLYNCHNGYYSHGFEFTRGGETLREGRI